MADFSHLTRISEAARAPSPLSGESEASLRLKLAEAQRAFNRCREGDGHGGSPGEGHWEMIDEIETELKRRGLDV